MEVQAVALSGQFHVPAILPLGKELSVPVENEAGRDADPVRTYPRSISLTVTEKLTDKRINKNDFIQANHSPVFRFCPVPRSQYFPVMFYRDMWKYNANWMQQRFLLQILLLAQHVSGTTMPIIRSSRVLYSGCCLWYFVL